MHAHKVENIEIMQFQITIPLLLFEKSIFWLLHIKNFTPNKEGKVIHSWPPFICWNIKYQEVRVSPVFRFY